MNTKWELITINPYEDSRGALKKIIMKSQLDIGNQIEEVYLLYSEKGSVRGNHFHQKTLEYFIVVSGQAKIVLKDMLTAEQVELFISAEDNVVIKVPPLVAHGFKNEEEKTLVLLAVSSMEYNKNDTDTYAEQVLV